MPDFRRIGTWVSGGKHLDSAFETLAQHQFTAAQMWLTTPTQPWKIHALDNVFAVRSWAHEIQLFVHAPYNTALFPPLVKHGKQMAWLKLFGRAVDSINAGIVLHFGHPHEYLDTALQAALQMLESLPAHVPVYIENAGGTEWSFKDFVQRIEAIKRVREQTWICFDTAHGWSRGWPTFEEDTRVREAAYRTLRPYVGLLHLNNTFVASGSQDQGEYFPIFNGNISAEQFAEVLTAFPGVPVVLERSNYMQSVVDRAAVIAMDAKLTSTLEALKKDPLSRQLLQ